MHIEGTHTRNIGFLAMACAVALAGCTKNESQKPPP